MVPILATFIHISDTHISDDTSYSLGDAPQTSYEGAVQLVEAVNALDFPIDFVLHTGDVAYDPHPEAYANCREVLSKIRFPLFYVAGNHDESAALQRHLLGNDDPMPALHYDFDVNGVQVAVVDSNGPAEPPAGFMTDEQLDWLSAICSADDPRPLVIATHHSPTGLGVPWLDDYMGIQNTDAFHAALLPARDRLRGVFFGHVHQNIDVHRDGILYASTLSSWKQFDAYPGMERTTPDPLAEPGFSIVSIMADRTYIRRCRLPLPR